MNKITILLFALIATTAFGADCDTNFLSTAFDFLLLDTDIDSADFEYCASLQAGRSCCSAATVAAFQDDAETLVAALAESVATRDVNLLSLRNQAIAYQDAMDRLTASIESAGDGLSGFSFGSLEDGFESFLDTIEDNIETFTDYQEARGECVKYLVNIQTAAWCLACAPSEDVTDALTEGELVLTETAEDAAAAACIDYFEAAETQTAAIAFYYTGQIFVTLADIIDRLIAGDVDAIADLTEAFINMIDTTLTAEDASLLPVTAPSGCTETSCSWISTDLFVNGELNWDLLAAGGEVSGTVEDDSDEGEVRRLAKKNARRLQDVGWTPSQTESGVEIEWEDNPGEVDASDTSSSAFRTGVIASVLALFALLF